MNQNLKLQDSIKQLLLDQYKSAINSFDSAQDSLDKAYTAILFAEIAFYISKIKPTEHIIMNALIVLYMAITFFLVFYSFMKSKTTFNIYKEMIEVQIYMLDEDDPKLFSKLKHYEKEFNISNRILIHLNRQIPSALFISSCFCFTKVCTNDYKLSLIINTSLTTLSFIISVIIYLYTFFRK